MHSCIIRQLNLYCDTKLFTTLEAASLHETTNIVKHHHHRLRYHQTKTSTQTSAKSRVEGKTEAFRFTNKSEAKTLKNDDTILVFIFTIWVSCSVGIDTKQQ